VLNSKTGIRRRNMLGMVAARPLSVGWRPVSPPAPSHPNPAA